MKKLLQVVVALMFVAGFTQLSLAAEHGGQEHGGTTAEAPSAEAPSAKMPAAEDIRSTMKNHVLSHYRVGAFNVEDPETGKTRKLQLVRVHERVGKTGDYYYSCADFKDIDSGELLDLDLDVEDQNGTLKVVDVRIHKVGGVERYTYDANDNRIPLEHKESHKGSAGAEAELGGQEHGGQELGGQELGGKEHGGEGI